MKKSRIVKIVQIGQARYIAISRLIPDFINEEVLYVKVRKTNNAYYLKITRVRTL
jgi:hypothetical protein